LLIESRTRAAALTALPELTIVAFSDPNDLLSFKLPASLSVPAKTRIVNVTVSNDWTYFGWAERPDTAHCGYKENPTVISVIAYGYHGGGLPNLGPVNPDNACLGG
jgi:hypothetical protein